MEECFKHVPTAAFNTQLPVSFKSDLTTHYGTNPRQAERAKHRARIPTLDIIIIIKRKLVNNNISLKIFLERCETI